jgi:hypothetical protein
MNATTTNVKYSKEGGIKIGETVCAAANTLYNNGQKFFSTQDILELINASTNQTVSEVQVARVLKRIDAEYANGYKHYNWYALVDAGMDFWQYGK